MVLPLYFPFHALSFSSFSFLDFFLVLSLSLYDLAKEEGFVVRVDRILFDSICRSHLRRHKQV